MSERLVVRRKHRLAEYLVMPFAGLWLLSVVPVIRWWSLVLFPAAIAAGYFVFVNARRRWEVDGDVVTVVVRGRRTEVRLADIVVVRTHSDIRKGPDFTWVSLATRTSDVMSISMDVVDSVLFAKFVQARDPDIAIDPQEPWCDRTGEWHGALHSKDPIESIRSIRHAATGRWAIDIKVHDAQHFQVVAHTVAGPPGLWAGEVHESLDAATDDAVAMIEELRHEG